MAYLVHDLGHGKQVIGVRHGRICHITRREDGAWTVDEDEQHRVFPQYDAALDCAREIAGDPDLPPLTQI